MSAAAPRTAVLSQGGLARRTYALGTTGSGPGRAGSGSSIAGASGSGRVTIPSSISRFADIGVPPFEHGSDGDAAKGSPDPVSPAVSGGCRNASQKRVMVGRGRDRLKVVRRFIEDPRAVDAVVVVLATWFVLGAYVTAYGYVSQPGHVLDTFEK